MSDIRKISGSNAFSEESEFLKPDQVDSSQAAPTKEDLKKELKKDLKSNAVSVAFLNQEISLKELLPHMSEKMADAKMDQLKKDIKTKLDSQFKENLASIVPQGLSTEWVKKSAALMNKKIEKKDSLKAEATEASSLFDENQNMTNLASSQTGTGHLSEQTKKEKSTTMSKITLPDSQLMQENIQKFVSAFSESLFTEKPQKKEEIKNIKAKLLQEGLSTKNIGIIEQNVKQFVVKDLKKEIKQRFLKLSMSYEGKKIDPEIMQNYKHYQAIMNMGESLGFYDTHQDLLTSSTKEEMRGELRAFVAGEMDRNLVEKKLNHQDSQELITAFNQLNHLAGIANFDPSEYMKNLRQKIDHMGLNPFIAPQSGFLDTDANKERKRNPQEEIEAIQEAGLQDQLLKTYIAKFLNPELIPFLKNSFKAYQLEKKLEQFEQDSKNTLLKQAESIAKLRLMFLLRKAFEERATLKELKGEEFSLVHNQIKKAVRGLKKMGIILSKQRMNAIRDEANKSIFPLLREEYVRVEMRLAENPKHTGLHRRAKELYGILNRLKSESLISEDIKPKLLQELSFLSDVNIIEAA